MDMERRMFLSESDGFWARVRLEPVYAEMRAAVIRSYEAERDEAFMTIPYALRHEYYENGSRVAFERCYFRRRRFLSSAAVLALIYPEEQRYIDEIIEAMWAIMDEYCWAVPAHVADDFELNASFIDLFTAETAFLLAEISTVLGDRIPETVHKRIRHEIDVRVTTGLRIRRYWWEENCTNNWAAVCAGGCGMALMYVDPAAFEKMKGLFLSAMDNFLAGYPEDGTCLEGTGYWHYGFGYFWGFADLLYRYTNGETDLFRIPKVERIASYMQRTFLRGNTTVSYADGSRPALHIADPGMQHDLHRRFPNSVVLLPDAVTAPVSLGNTGWLYLYRDFLFTDPAAQHAVKTPELRDVFLPDAGQVMFHRPPYSLAVKAGHNDEPHNHNDVGSFILSTADGQVLADIGCGLYTREYFMPEKRYTFLCNHSGGHSVPIVNGTYQTEGREYCGTLLPLGEDTVKISMEKAYGQTMLSCLRRTLKAGERTVLLTDEFSKEVTAFTDRFVTLKAPVLTEAEDGKKALILAGEYREDGASASKDSAPASEDGASTLEDGAPASEDGASVSKDSAPASEAGASALEGGASVSEAGLVRMTWDDSAVDVKISVEEHACHNAASPMLPVYLIDLAVKPERRQVTVRFEVL